MRQLRHKNIVELLKFIDAPEYYFIVLELIPGGELFHQIVRLTYFSEELSRHVIVQVAEAIRYLHEEAGVVHRDIKPENLLFYPSPYIPSPVKQVRAGEDENKQDEGVFIPGVGAGGIGVIKLADFGLSKIIWDANTMTPCGTVGYTAPEIVNDQRYSKSVDMWSLGCVLYTILCGFPPFYDENVSTLTEKVAQGQYEFLSPWWDEISKGAKDLVSHLLTVDPRRRYTITEFLNHPWITQSNIPTRPALDSPVLNPGHHATTEGISEQKVTISKLVAEEAEFNRNNNTFSATSITSSNKNANASTTPLVEDYPTAGLAVPDGFSSPMDKGIMSPAVVAMKEAFDVFNAVHRQEEEIVTQQRARGVRGSGGAKSVFAKKKAALAASGAMTPTTLNGFLGELGEEDEEEEHSNTNLKNTETSSTRNTSDLTDEDVNGMKNLNLSNTTKQSSTNGQDNNSSNSTLQNISKVNSSNSNKPEPSSRPMSREPSHDKFFELSLEGSTLIERRKRASSSGSTTTLGSNGHPLSAGSSSLGLLSMAMTSANTPDLNNNKRSNSKKKNSDEDKRDDSKNSSDKKEENNYFSV